MRIILVIFGLMFTSFVFAYDYPAVSYQQTKLEYCKTNYSGHPAIFAANYPVDNINGTVCVCDSNPTQGCGGVYGIPASLPIFDTCPYGGSLSGYHMCVNTPEPSNCDSGINSTVIPHVCNTKHTPTSCPNNQFWSVEGDGCMYPNETDECKNWKARPESDNSNPPFGCEFTSCQGEHSVYCPVTLDCELPSFICISDSSASQQAANQAKQQAAETAAQNALDAKAAADKAAADKVGADKAAADKVIYDAKQAAAAATAAKAAADSAAAAAKSGTDQSAINAAVNAANDAQTALVNAQSDLSNAIANGVLGNSSGIRGGTRTTGTTGGTGGTGTTGGTGGTGTGTTGGTGGTGTGTGSGDITCDDIGTCSNGNSAAAGVFGSAGDGAAAGLAAANSVAGTAFCDTHLTDDKCKGRAPFISKKISDFGSIAHVSGTCPTAIINLSILKMGSHVIDSHCALLETVRPQLLIVAQVAAAIIFVLIVISA